MSVRIIILINFIVYVLSAYFNIASYFGAHYIFAETWQPYQAVTYMFIHGNFLHFFFNMLALLIFGGMLEKVWGFSRFIIYYLICGIGAVFFYYTIFHSRVDPLPVMVGASGAIFGIIVAFGLMFPDQNINILFLIPVKAKQFVVIYAIIELALGFSNISGDIVAHFAHLGGMITGLLFLKINSFLSE